MRSLTKSEWVFLAIVLVYSFIPAVLALVRIPELLGAPPLVPPNPRAVIAPVPIILHILASSIFCLAGAVQFLPSLRRTRPAFHRSLGRIVVATGSISALTGLWMTVSYVFPQALQGPLLYWARVFLSLAMFASLVWAVLAIRARNVAGHRAAMLRSYAIGQGASTQTMLLIMAMALSGVEPLGLVRDLIMIAAWGANLVAAEFLIRRTSATRTFPVAVSRRASSQA
ncbi:DUF2306 domain-containing protein [Epibacterium sp. Ofav1-8]|uniref:DUF2306 domain-containing protein n=1 Tax=Epibacterium sp. Ofav1-8 TaxID=2917735 RepID=UPI001EF6AEB2|nr:DUF2306 domain-containing protein [Epibacterium sp. Ofav1-8]MCG7623521.1 DUF2306 domain-containing protein [Epibacterium sp. Ofav1-8]